MIDQRRWDSDIDCAEVAGAYVKHFITDETWMCDDNFGRLYSQCRIIIMGHTNMAVKSWDELAQEAESEWEDEESDIEYLRQWNSQG